MISSLETPTKKDSLSSLLVENISSLPHYLCISMIATYLAILSLQLVLSKAHNAIIENLMSFEGTELAIFTDSRSIETVIDQQHFQRVQRFGSFA